MLFVILSIPIYWLLSTQSGLNVSYWLLRANIPGVLELEQLNGRWTDKIIIKNIKYNNKFFKLNAEEMIFETNIKSILYKTLSFPNFSIKNASISLKENANKTLISEASGNIAYQFFNQDFAIHIEQCRGYSQNKLVSAKGGIKVFNNTIAFENSFIQIGDNKLVLLKSLTHPNQWNWTLTFIPSNNMSINLDGLLFEPKQNNDWSGTIQIARISSELLGNFNLKSPSNMNFSTKHLYLPLLELIHTKGEILKIVLNWKKDQQLLAEIDMPTLYLKHKRFRAFSAFHFYVSQKSNQDMEMKSQFLMRGGHIDVSQNELSTRLIPFQNLNMDMEYNQSGLAAKVKFSQNSSNFLHGNFHTLPFTNILHLLEQPLEGVVEGSWKDLNFLHALIPQLGSIQGQIQISAKAEGKVKAPIFHIESKAISTQFSIPKYGLKLYQLNLGLTGNVPGTLAMAGTGKSGKGEFQIKGQALVQEENKFSIDFNGKHIQIYNLPNIKAEANPNLTIDYIKGNLFIKGQVEINDAIIFLKDTTRQTVLSKDIVIIGNDTDNLHTLKIVPSIYVELNQAHFKGYSLDGIISGKLDIEERPDGLLSGTGRLSIKEGKYRLQGSLHYIHHGRLLFPSGTLLTDPLLDIRISQMRNQTDEDVGIYVQGTLQRPVLSQYSNARLQNKDILSSIDPNSSASNDEIQQKQLVSRTALLFAGKANPIIEAIQNNLGLEEINLESHEKSVSTEGGTETVVVLGKSLSKKLYLQFMQNLMEPLTTIKLKYFLGSKLTASVETNTEEDIGGDLTYSVEKD